MRLLPALLICLSMMTTAHAQALVDLTPSSVIVHNHTGSFVKRDGKPYIFENPAKGQQLRGVGKGAELRYVDFWFPQTQAPTVSRVEFKMGAETPTRWRVQNWVDDHWTTIAVRDPANPGPDSTIDFEPVKARGIRLLIEETYTIGFNEYILADASVKGPTQDTPVPAQLKWTLEAKPELSVFQLGEEVVVTGALQSTAPEAESLELRWQWVDWYQRPITVEERKAVSIPAGTNAPLSFTWKPEQQGPYFLRVHAWRNGGKAGEAMFLVGVRDENMDEKLEIEPFASKKSGRVRDEKDLIGPGKMLFGSELYHFSNPFHYLPPEAHFKALKEHKVELLGTLPNWEAVMPLPGVYNFGYLDHVVELSEEYGLLLETGYWRYWFGGSERPHWWMEDELIVERSGKPGENFNHAFSYFGPKFQKYMLRSVSLIVKRYKDHPSLGVWNFQPYGHVDWGWMGNLSQAYDYSSFAQDDFRKYLRDERGYTLETISERYGQKFNSWEEIELPVAISFQESFLKSRSDNLWDDRPIWFDFVEWRHRSGTNASIQLWDLIRKYDRVRPMGTWMSILSGAGEEKEKISAEYGIPGGSNGAEWTEYTRMSIAQRRYGRDSRQEHGGQIDGRHKDSAGEMHNMIFNNNIFRTKYFNYVFPVWEKNPAWEVFTNPRSRQLVADMADAEIPTSPIGAIHSMDSDWFEGRNSLAFIELDRWWRMLAWGEYMTSKRWIEWYSNVALDGLDQRKIIIDNHSRAMRPEAIDALYTYVSNGGRLVLWSNSGQYTYGKIEPQWELLKRLGYEDVQSLGRTERRGMMKPVADNGVFKSFEEMPMGDWTPLKKEGAKVLATIDDQPAAITWPVGKGHVLLITGEEVSPDIQELIVLEPPPVGKTAEQGKRYWDARIAMRRSLIDTAKPLYDDIVGFAGELPEREWAVEGVERAYYKRKGLDHHFVCMFNSSETEPTGEITATLRVPAGTYELQYWSLDGYESLGQVSAEDLAKGVKLKGIAPRRMQTLRAERVR